MSSFTAIDLTKLPVPDVFDPIDLAVLEAQARDLFVAGFPAAAATIDLDSDPIRKLIQISAYLRFVDRDKFRKDAAIGLVTTATGAGLDARAAQVPVERLDGESDEAFRPRIIFAIRGISPAGPVERYITLALGASVEVRAVAIRTPHVSDDGPDAPSAGQVFVYVLGADDGTLPTEVRDAVEAVLTDEFNIPTSAEVLVKDPTPVAFNIDAELVVSGSLSAAVVRDAAEAALDTYLGSRIGFGSTVTLAGITSALVVEGVVDVILTEPATNPASDPYSVPVIGTRTVALAGGS